MKSIFKNVFLLIILVTGTSRVFAQQYPAEPSGAQPGKIEPYYIQVTYDKTTHLIFPSKIRYVDLGSDYLLAGKAEDAENVLRVKAAVRDFPGETNFSVITDNGDFYNFNVQYNANPSTLNYDLVNKAQNIVQNDSSNVLLEELGTHSPSVASSLLESIYNENKRNIRHIGTRSYGILFSLKAIYIHEGKYYFHTELQNRSNVPFVTDFIQFKVVDKKIAKRTVIQEQLMKSLRNYLPLGEINGQSVKRNVFMLDQFTIADDKVLLIEIFEKNGGRHQSLEVQNADLIRAKYTNELLTFNNTIIQ